MQWLLLETLGILTSVPPNQLLPPIGNPMQSFLTATAHFALFLVPCLITTIVHIVTTSAPADPIETLG